VAYQRTRAQISPDYRAETFRGDVMGLDKLPLHVLVVDDEDIICQQLERLYISDGYCVDIANTGEEALERLAKGDIDLLVTDLRLPGISGVELTTRTRKEFPDLPVIVITGHGALDSAIEVLKEGAIDYILKPFSLGAIQQATQTAITKSRVCTEIRHLRQLLKSDGIFGGMLSFTPEMHRVFETIRMVAATDMTVLVEGETGTGKELVATAVHYQSARKSGPFITINCAGFPEPLLESELFGYERGAFTGANRTRVGKIELAHGGTLFLDEIESMSLPMQSKLLRVLEDQQVQRLGANRKIQIDMRVIAASNVPIEKLLAEGMMRPDFYYRINVVPIRLLPLRERRDDIPLLVDDFLRHHRVAKQKGVTGVSPSVMNRLMNYHWLGNIRELQNVLEKAIVFATGRIIEKVDLPRSFASDVPKRIDGTSIKLTQWLEEQEKQFLIQQLKSFNGKIGLAAKNCGLPIRTLSRKMYAYGLKKIDFHRKDAQPLSDKIDSRRSRLAEKHR
jgi:DNA-binding NtrC family response regulator